MMKPTTSYLICATQRSGSTLLCEALRNTGLAGCPDEYFWRDNVEKWRRAWKSRSYSAYLAHVIEHTITDNGVFGAKIMWSYLPDFARRLAQLPDCRNLNVIDSLTAVFPNLHFIAVTRRNKVRQAISLYRAVQTQQWSVFSQPARSAPLPYDREAIDGWRQEILRQENSWQRFFTENEVHPYPVVYEDFAPAYEATALDILRFLGVKIPDVVQFGPRYLRRQADDLTGRWERRYRQTTS